jgi:hypothetical protein
VEEVIRFALLGLGIGATYALASQGLIIVYRGSGVLNFALGAIGMAGAYVWWELNANQGWAFLPALIAGVLFAAVIGGLVHLLIMRPLRHSAPLVRVIATLGVLITIQSIAILRYTATSKFVASALPTDIVHIHNTIVISADRLILLGIAVPTPVWLTYRVTSVWAMPTRRPTKSAIGKERKPATRAAAVAASTRFVSTAGCRVTIGTIRIAASPARPQPSAQFSVATVSGERPSAEAERSDSATAEVASPKRV